MTTILSPRRSGELLRRWSLMRTLIELDVGKGETTNRAPHV